jgi:hypothetical protein
MPNIEISSHAQDMLRERDIPEEWVWQTVNSADQSEFHVEDGNWHYTKAIREKDNRILRVVVNQNASPYRVVTIFFDRRLRKKK